MGVLEDFRYLTGRGNNFGAKDVKMEEAGPKCIAGTENKTQRYEVDQGVIDLYTIKGKNHKRTGVIKAALYDKDFGTWIYDVKYPRVEITYADCLLDNLASNELEEIVNRYIQEQSSVVPGPFVVPDSPLKRNLVVKTIPESPLKKQRSSLANQAESGTSKTKEIRVNIPMEIDEVVPRKLFDDEAGPSNSGFLSSDYSDEKIKNGVQYIKKEVCIEITKKIKGKNEINHIPGIIVDYRYYPEKTPPGYYYDIELNNNKHEFYNDDQIVDILGSCYEDEDISLEEPKEFKINLFDVLDKIKPVQSGIELRHHRLRQLFTFCQFPIFDTIHDMVVGDNLKEYKKIYIYDVLLRYREEMLTLITLDDIKNIEEPEYELSGKQKLTPKQEAAKAARIENKKQEYINTIARLSQQIIDPNARNVNIKAKQANIEALKIQLAELNEPNTPIKSGRSDKDFDVAVLPKNIKDKLEKEEKYKEQVYIEPNALKNLKSSHLLNYLEISRQDTINIKKLEFIKKYIYPNYDDIKNPDYEIFGMFSLTKKYITSLTGSKLPGKEDKEVGEDVYTNEDLGVNVSNIFPVNALEILGMRPFGYNKLGQYNVNFKDFIYKIQLSQQEDHLRNKIITTFDTIGPLPNLTNTTGLLRKEIDPNIELIDLRTPAKNYDSAWIFDNIFGDKKTITMSGETHYNIYFQNKDINEGKEYTFAKFDLLNGGKSLKLYYFGNYLVPEGLETAKGKYAPKSSSNRHVAIKIAECYNNFEKEGISQEDQRKIVLFMSFFKFGGDFIQGIWQYILAYPNEFKANTNYINFYKQQELNGLKLHIATDTLSAIISSLFGGLVVTANSQFGKLPGLQAGGTEFFFINENNYNYYQKKFENKPILQKHIEQSIINIYNCEKKNNSELSWVEFFKNIGNYEKSIIKQIINQHYNDNGILEGFSDKCNDDKRIQQYFENIKGKGKKTYTWEQIIEIMRKTSEKNETEPLTENEVNLLFDQEFRFGKKRVKDLSEDFKYLLTLNEF
jgi:hypothetical protein